MSYKYTIVLMLLLFSAEYCCGSRSSVAFRRSMRAATENENLGIKLENFATFRKTAILQSYEYILYKV